MSEVLLGTVIHAPAGEAPSDFKPGDFLLTHQRFNAKKPSTYFGALIRFGQRIRFRKDRRPFAWFNHAVLVVNEAGDTIEALARGLVRGNVSDYEPQYYAHVRPAYPHAMSGELVAKYGVTAYERGTRYGWLSIVSIGAQLLTGTRLSLDVVGSMICSEYVAEALARGGTIWPKAAAAVAPADLAEWFGVVPISVEVKVTNPVFPSNP